MKIKVFAIAAALSGMITGIADAHAAERAASGIGRPRFKPAVVAEARALALAHPSRGRNGSAAIAKSAAAEGNKTAARRIEANCSPNGRACRLDRRHPAAGHRQPGFGARAFILESPVSFISRLEERALAAVRDGNTAAAQQWRFRQVYRQYFDTEAGARAALGPYWRHASEQQRQEFIKSYEDYVVISYSLPLGQIGAQSFKVFGSRRDQQGVIVMSRIDGLVPLEVDWRVTPTAVGYKVSNVFVDGIDMAELQRSDMVSVIQRNSGQLAPLLVALRAKNTSNGITR